MKQWIVLCMAVLLLTTLAACGGNQDGPADAIALAGTSVALGVDYATVADGLGTPVDTQEAVSCHYDGTDTIYYFDGYTVYTYRKDAANIVYSIEVTDPAVKTPEGAAVGMSADQVKGLYGDSFTTLPNGFSYPLDDSGAVLNFRVKDDRVFCIEYYVE